MSPSTLRNTFALTAGLLVSVSAASAASLNHPGPVVTADGAYSAIVESSITDTPPLYGAPTPGPGNKLTFDMPGFTASATNSGSDITAGALEFTFDADPGQTIQSISLMETGLYDILGDADVTATGTLTVRYFDTLTQQIETLAEAIVMTTDPIGGFPVSTPGQGTWAGNALIDLAQLGIVTDQITVALDNILIAGAGPEGTGTISKEQLMLDINTIPEPASLALMGMGLGLIIRKR